jgi:hypothetical protein
MSECGRVLKGLAHIKISERGSKVERGPLARTDRRGLPRCLSSAAPMAHFVLDRLLCNCGRLQVWCVAVLHHGVQCASCLLVRCVALRCAQCVLDRSVGECVGLGCVALDCAAALVWTARQCPCCAAVRFFFCCTRFAMQCVALRLRAAVFDVVRGLGWSWVGFAIMVCRFSVFLSSPPLPRRPPEFTRALTVHEPL